MTPAAQKYFKLYFQLERLVDDEKSHSYDADNIREDLEQAYEEMSDTEKQLLDIVDKKIIKDE
jgi:hypothetical protein